jgi:PAS domain S-box-containing protein
LPFIFVIGTVSFFGTIAAPPNYGAGRLKSAILMNGFADRIECSARTAVCCRTMNAPWQMCCAQVFPCANRKYTLSDRTACVGIALLDIEVIKDSDGNIVGAVNCFQDITERKRGEEAALRLAAIIETSDDAIVSEDLDGGIRSWNGGAQRIFGYLAEEVIGKPNAILIPPDRHNEETAILERLRRGDRINSYETVRRHKDGSPVNVSLTVSPLKNTEGRVIGASKIARNITERLYATSKRSRHDPARI